LDAQRQRLIIYIPVAAVVSLVLLMGVYFFVSFEKTSITTLPTAEIAKAFVPQTPTPVPPTPTPAPTFTPSPTSNVPTPEGGATTSASIAWNGDLDFIFKQRCGTCHGTTGGFSALSYADVMKKISAGSPDSSDVVKVQQAGNHPGKFTSDELNRVIDWIKAGAPEQGASTGANTGPTTPVNSTWDGNISAMFQEKCKVCHGSIGGFNAQTYANVMKKIEAGNPDSSDVVKVQQGTHPALFTPAELQVIIDWIKAGAPEK
jgi:mono/diheme cytochrome c family protein